MAATKEKTLGSIASIEKSENFYSIRYETGEYAQLSVLNNHVFRFYMSPTGEFLEYPTPKNATDIAKINCKSVKDYGKCAFVKSVLKQTDNQHIIETNKLHIIFEKISGTLSVHDKKTDNKIFNEQKPIKYNDSSCKQTLHQNKEEYYFGGGMQNGRFTHKGEIIHIVNTNNWVDGGVTSPNPFYWTTKGYGVLRNTWQDGCYDFGSKGKHIIETIHNEGHIDAFYFVNTLPKDILNDYYELTGRPIFMPEFAFYEAHLNTFNRDYWVEVGPNEPHAILFEDGKYYKSYQPKEMENKTGILESLNGEKNNYQFSARAMIDRYKMYDMPLGWFVPNDGYGSGYGQTDSLGGDLNNLREFIEYANENGVEVALWTESRLEPKDPDHPKKGERDLSQEVKVGAVALKCDVAWIGEGYSFGLNAVENATKIFLDRAQNSLRPLIIMVDGWAGTQRYAGIWSGDQTGGQWEYIRFHIPTYIGSGLSGIPIVGSDMDGIYGGGDREVNIRDFQWKTFTPLQLNMDGWGNVEKTPFTNNYKNVGADINKAYLKLKSMLLPYNYTIARKSINGLPMLRAMFLEFPQEKSAYTKDSQYQFMWGPSILVAPVYSKPEDSNEPVRNGVYLPDPEQIWIDLFTGDKYQGGKIYNNLKTPLWKIPVFVKDGAIIPLVNPNNNPSEVNRENRVFLLYPNEETTYKVYEDDGKSSEYLEQQYAKTKIAIKGPLSNESGNVSIHVHKTTGHYKGMIKERTTVLQIMASDNVQSVKAHINENNIEIEKVKTKEEFEQKHNVYYFDQKYIVNPYMAVFQSKKLIQKRLCVKIEKANVTETEIKINIKGYSNKSEVFGSNSSVIESLKPPKYLTSLDDETTDTSITIRWEPNKDAFYYEIERDDTIFSNILGEKFTFDDFKYESTHTFRIRSVTDQGVSKWSYAIIVETKPSPLKDLVEDVTVICNIPCQKTQEIHNLTKTDCHWWHTHWDKPCQADSGKTITLSFDLNDVYPISKIKYVPREDGGNGTFLKVQYRHSVDGKTWSKISPVTDWNRDANTKVIEMDGVEFQYFELNVLESVGGFGAGRNVLFYKKL